MTFGHRCALANLCGEECRQKKFEKKNIKPFKPWNVHFHWKINIFILNFSKISLMTNLFCEFESE